MTSQVPIRTYNEYGYKDEYRVNNQLHREDGPALIEYLTISQSWRENYYWNGQRHREDGPAIICHSVNSTIWYESYYWKDQRHREDGPAYIEYNENGIAIIAIGYIEGEKTNTLYDPSTLYNHRTPLYKPVL